ncbi:MAG: hypothetical protein ACI9S8_001615 [Chlamydiales bacterium]|jgi:uncharacterized protein YbbC (DUF1343 family)
MKKKLLFLLILSCLLAHQHSVDASPSGAKISVGIDILCSTDHLKILDGKRVGLITNHTAINRHMESSIEAIKSRANLVALFAPEHGISGLAYAAENIETSKGKDDIPIYSLHGATRRPTPEMLKDIDILIYDIQDIGSRSYTYITTLFYAMEEAAKRKIKVVVLDRPNPMGGLVVDGPMLDNSWRSYVGYINVPYCHGMTVGELAQFFNNEYKVDCDLTVVPMRGWTRDMTFHDTGLPWIPTSPHIPEDDTAFYYPTTGILGELQIVSIGIGYTLPFKLVGAPWVDADIFAKHLNKQNLPGVHFQPFHYKPFYGKFQGKDCHGIRIIITNPAIYKPVSTQYLIIGILKSLYPSKFKEGLKKSAHRKEMFCKVNGTEEVYQIISEKKYVGWALIALHEERRHKFLKLRKKYLNPQYSRAPVAQK